MSDVDRAKRFYESLGWRLDADFAVREDYRVVQLTPPGSECSIIFRDGVSSAAQGSVEGLHLVVFDIEAARDELVHRGVDVSEVFHDSSGVFHHAGTEARVPGLDPERQDYGSFASFSDPDGDRWFVQEVKTRTPEDQGRSGLGRRLHQPREGGRTPEEASALARRHMEDGGRLRSARSRAGSSLGRPGRSRLMSPCSRVARHGGAGGFAAWELSAELDSWERAPAPTQEVRFHDPRHRFGTRIAAAGCRCGRSRSGWATAISRPS